MKEQIYISGFIFGILILYSFFGSSVKCGINPKIIINIPPLIINSKIYIGNFHLHHWMLGIIIIFICWFLRILNLVYIHFYFLYGFSFALIIHGLFYQDCFDFR